MCKRAHSGHVHIYQAGLGGRRGTCQLIKLTSMADDGIMGEDAVQPRENKENGENGTEEENEGENINEEEFEAINAQLDQLNSALDSLERKNDDIHAELVELLKSNREAREQFQESSKKEQSQEPEKPNP